MSDRNTGNVHKATKVAVIIGTLDVGGAELDIVRNVPLLSRSEFEIVVLEFGHAGPLGASLREQGIRVISRREFDGSSDGNCTGGNRWMQRWCAVCQTVLRIGRVTQWLGRQLRRERIDIAHAFLPHSYVYQMFACFFWAPRAKRVMSRLSVNFYRHEQPLIAFLERYILHRRVHVAIANARVILDELEREGVDRSKLRLVHNGIDPIPFRRTSESRLAARERLGLSHDAYVMAAVGNLHTYKGHGDLIRACAESAQDLPPGWRLLIAGRDQDGNLAQYEEMVQEFGLTQSITLLGECDVRTLLHSADMFCHPSHHEGLPNAIIEAMAAGLPVVGTNVGGISELVIAEGEERTGWLVAPANAPALGSALVEAADMITLRAQMGSRAAERVEREFTVAKSAARYEEIYRELEL